MDAYALRLSRKSHWHRLTTKYFICTLVKLKWETDVGQVLDVGWLGEFINFHQIRKSSVVNIYDWSLFGALLSQFRCHIAKYLLRARMFVLYMDGYWNILAWSLDKGEEEITPKIKLNWAFGDMRDQHKGSAIGSQAISSRPLFHGKTGGGLEFNITRCPIL